MGTKTFEDSVGNVLTIWKEESGILFNHGRYHKPDEKFNITEIAEMGLSEDEKDFVIDYLKEELEKPQPRFNDIDDVETEADLSIERGEELAADY